MSQTEIKIVAPDRAGQGKVIDVEVSIYNRTTSPEPHNIDFACPVVRVGGKTIYVGDERNIAYWEPIDVETWKFKYTMPAESVTLNVESWFESYYYSWHRDATASKNISLEEGVMAKIADIVSMAAPGEAAYAQKVEISVLIKNISSVGYYISAFGYYTYNGDVKSGDLAFSPDYAWIPAGGSQYFTGTFTMPNSNVKAKAISMFWDGSYWVQDDSVSVTIKLKTAPQYTVTVKIEPAGAGYVVKNPDLPYYPADSYVTLTAYHDLGYQFKEWYWDSAYGGEEPSINIRVGANIVVRAIFVYVGAGPYTEISMTAPDNAVAGSNVTVGVYIKNLCDYSIWVTPIGRYDGSQKTGALAELLPGKTRSWSFSFTMPSTDVTVIAESWCGSDYFDWHLDASTQKNINLAKDLIKIISVTPYVLRTI